MSECSSFEEDEASLVLRESRADFLEVSLRLLDPSAWGLVAYSGFFREGSIIILEAGLVLHVFDLQKMNIRQDVS